MFPMRKVPGVGVTIPVPCMVSVVCLATMLSVHTAQSEPNLIDQSIVPAEAWTGEPYALAGKRIVFTDWYYIRPGGYSWRDENGNAVTASKSSPIGPWGATFVRGQDAPWGIRLRAEHAQRMAPAISQEKPWEKGNMGGFFVLHDGDHYRAWANTAGGPAYYESRDGLTWNRPELSLVEFEGSKANNLIPTWPGCVFIDPSAPPSERYKGVSDGSITPEEFEKFRAAHPDRWEHRALRKDAGFISALYGYTSPDGISFQRFPEPFTVEHSDTLVTGTYDPRRKEYRIYTRNYFVGPRALDAPPDEMGMGWLGESQGSGRRSIGMTRSRTFGDFSLSEVILTPRSDMAPYQLLYTNCYTTIPGAPDQQLLFPAVWDTSTDTTQLELAASHDGRVWNWVPGGPLMETFEFGDPDGGCIFWNPNLVELGNGDWALPYTGYAFPHKYPRGAWSYRTGYALWPKGRLVALEAPERGEFTTVSLMPPGRTLLINAVTERAGEIRIAVTNRDGTILEGRGFENCEAVVGDKFQVPVKWDGQEDLGFEKGQPICLKFRLNKAKIYGLVFQ